MELQLSVTAEDVFAGGAGFSLSEVAFGCDDVGTKAQEAL